MKTESCFYVKKHEKKEITNSQKLFDHLKLEKHRMNLFNVTHNIVNRVQSEFSNNQRNREDFGERN